jgi:hypothetical protein
MEGYFLQALKGMGAEPCVLWGSFAPNGGSDPDSDDNEGPPGLRAFTTAYAATGQYTVTLPAGLSLPANVTVAAFPQAADLAGYFEVMTVGAYDSTTRTFVIQAKRAASGNAPAAAAGCRIHFLLCFNNSTGA